MALVSLRDRRVRCPRLGREAVQTNRDREISMTSVASRTSEQVEQTRQEVAVGTRMLVDFGLSAGVRASLGHVSVRVPGQPDRFVVKGRGYRLDALNRIRPEDMVVVDMDGVWVDGPRNIVPCFEVKIHSCILRDHPNVNAVV